MKNLRHGPLRDIVVIISENFHKVKKNIKRDILGRKIKVKKNK